jgi:hypothetical protein
MDIKKFEVNEKDYKLIAELIQSDSSPVGIDAKKTHIIILNKLSEISARLERIEHKLNSK